MYDFPSNASLYISATCGFTRWYIDFCYRYSKFGSISPKSYIVTIYSHYIWKTTMLYLLLKQKQNIASQEDDGTIIIIAQRHGVNSKFIL